MCAARHRSFSVRPWFIGLGSLLGACSITLDRAYFEAPWDEGRIERLAIEGSGGWAQLRGKPLQIGEYQALRGEQGWWDNVPGETSVGIGLGDGDTGLGFGVSTVHNESDYRFRLVAQGADLAGVECQQYLHIENWQGGLGDIDFGQIIVEGNTAFLATLRCEAAGIHPDWPAWRLDLRATDQRPYFGVLRVGAESWSVAGTQRTDNATIQASTGFELRGAQDVILARLDRLNGGELALLRDLPVEQRMAVVASAAALMLANDPLEPR